MLQCVEMPQDWRKLFIDPSTLSHLGFLQYALEVDVDSLGNCEKTTLIRSLRIMTEAILARCCDLTDMVNELKGEMNSLKVPDYLPDDVKVRDWVRSREIEHRIRERELGLDLLPIKAETSPSSPPLQSTQFTELLATAMSNGFTWPGRGRAEPARQSTKERIVKEWMLQYEQGVALNDMELLDVKSVAGLGPGAIRAAVIRLGGNNVNNNNGLNDYNLYQKLVKEVKSGSGKGGRLEQKSVQSHISIAQVISDKVFGVNIHEEDEEAKSKLIMLIAERVTECGGVNGLDINQIKNCCSLSRLPAYVPWQTCHISANSKLGAIKAGTYDDYFEQLLVQIRVESQ